MRKKRHQALEDWVLSFLFVTSILSSSAIIVLCLSGCASAPLHSEKDAVYKYDMVGTINGYTFNGVGVVPRAQSYNMKIESRVDVDLLTVDSCHRSFSVESAISLGWFQKKRGYEYVYTPVAGIEDGGSCLVRVGAYNQGQGQNAWALFDFEDPQALLPALNVCDGQALATKGVSICQARAGLVERIHFPASVRLSQLVEERCKIKAGEDPMTWDYEMPKGECVFVFMETTPPYRYHRHTSVGFDQIEIRGN